jgi:hypothetical protein
LKPGLCLHAESIVSKRLTPPYRSWRGARSEYSLQHGTARTICIPCALWGRAKASLLRDRSNRTLKVVSRIPAGTSGRASPCRVAPRRGRATTRCRGRVAEPFGGTEAKVEGVETLISRRLLLAEAACGSFRGGRFRPTADYRPRGLGSSLFHKIKFCLPQ